MSDLTLQTIQTAQLLPANEMAELMAISDELRHTFETVQVFRTRTEMIVSVLDDIRRPTPDAKYWQAVREQDVHLNQLVELSFEWRKNEIEMRQIQRQLKRTKDDLERELLALELERRKYAAAQMRRVAHHRQREIVEWSRIKAELEPQLSFGTDDVDAHQLEAMRQRFAIEAELINAYTPPADARNILGLARTAERVAGERG